MWEWKRSKTKVAKEYCGAITQVAGMSCCERWSLNLRAGVGLTCIYTYVWHYIRGSIQNIPDWCRHLYSSCGSTKNLSQKGKLWIPGSNVKFWGGCVKTCEEVATNFGDNRPGCFAMTTPRLTLPSSPSSFWRNKKWLPSSTHCTPLIWHPVISSYSQIWNWSWKDTGLIPLGISRPNRKEGAWYIDGKGLPGNIPQMVETVGSVYICGAELVRGWCVPIVLMVSFMIFTASVRNIWNSSWCTHYRLAPKLPESNLNVSRELVVYLVKLVRNYKYILMRVGKDFTSTISRRT
jgi:hypothetical protein